MKDLFLKHIAQTSDAPIGLEIDRAEGIYIYTKDGRRFADMISGIAVSSLGHSHPEVVSAVKKQVENHMHVMVYGEFVQHSQVQFATLLASVLPNNLKRIYLVNSGTEAVEGALKLAKKFTKRTGLVAFKNSYHGDTHGSLSVTGRNVYRDPYLPLLPNVSFLDFNDHSKLESIDHTTACVILEPIQGEGGIIEANPEWLQAVRTRCSEVGTLLIFDEIQSGFGRTGNLFAFQGYNVQPDILCMAKAMGGGMPLGGFASSDRIFESFMYNPPLNHVTTFGGHPVSCAAAYAALNVLLRDNLVERAKKIGEQTKNKLNHHRIKEVRGKGAMLGIQLHHVEQTRKVVQLCFESGILLGWTLHSDTLIRFAPPLTIDIGELDQILDRILDAVISTEI